MGNFHLQKCFLLSLCGPDNNFLLETKLLGWSQHDLLWKGPENRQTSNMGQENFAYGGLFCAVRNTTWLSGSIMSLHTCRIHILLDAAVRCMLLHMRLLGVNYVVNDPCCFSSVMNSLTCFSESVEVPLHCTTCRRTFWFHSLADNVLWCSGRCMLAAFTRGKLPHLSILAGFL